MGRVSWSLAASFYSQAVATKLESPHRSILPETHYNITIADTSEEAKRALRVLPPVIYLVWLGVPQKHFGPQCNKSPKPYSLIVIVIAPRLGHCELGFGALCLQGYGLFRRMMRAWHKIKAVQAETCHTDQ